MRRTGVLQLLVIAFLAGCVDKPHDLQVRPPHVPPNAVLVGGKAGGDWMACEGTIDGILHCRIFDPLSQAFRESWFRYCPQLGAREAGDPVLLNWELGLQVSNAQLRRDRRDVFHPAPDTRAEKLKLELEMIEKYYQLDGVDADCTPVQRGEAGANSSM